MKQKFIFKYFIVAICLFMTGSLKAQTIEVEAFGKELPLFTNTEEDSICNDNDTVRGKDYNVLLPRHMKKHVPSNRKKSRKYKNMEVHLNNLTVVKI